MATFTENPILGEKYQRALSYAFEKHNNQVRKGIVQAPYIAHVISVSSIVLKAGGNETQAVAALLHDVVEDTNTTIEEIKYEFGFTVADIVAALSESDDQGKYIENIQHSSYSVAFVSACDKLDNLRDYLVNLHLVTPQLVEFYRNLLPVYLEKLGNNSPIVEELICLMRKL